MFKQSVHTIHTWTHGFGTRKRFVYLQTAGDDLSVMKECFQLCRKSAHQRGVTAPEHACRRGRSGVELSHVALDFAKPLSGQIRDLGCENSANQLLFDENCTL